MFPVKKPDIHSYHPEMDGNILNVEKGWCHFSHEGTKDFFDLSLHTNRKQTEFSSKLPHSGAILPRYR